MQTTETAVSKENLKSLLDIEKLKYCFECGVCTASCPMAELLGKDYNPRGLLEKIFLNPESVLNSEELWLCAWCYRCYRHCPQALKVPEILLFLRRIAVEHGFLEPLETAMQKIVENIPLPLATTLVCFHPERVGLDKEKILEKIEQIRFERFKKRKRTKATKNSKRKVAVIGSGPAGFTVAYQLAQKKCNVTVFEALLEAGGMLRRCISEYRLPKRVLAKEIQFIKDMGVEIRTGVTIGKDLSFESLWNKGYKAIFIGAGAHESQKLRVEGVDLEGVVHALDFLWKMNSGEKMEMGKKAAVIGGGNVAIDAARTALQNGAKEATIFYRRSREEMPANPWEIKEAEDEGLKIEFLVAPKRFLGKDGKVSSIEFVRMQLGELDESGRRKPVPIEGSEFTMEADMVILAIGETPNLTFLPKEVELNEDGTVWVDPITMETSLQGVFAGGDAVTGPATVIEAIKAGKRAAESIENYLESLGG
ncbi:MAG: FAD-dependent oxidoreductase [Candidatus Bathycorpusculaceae bacterium]